MSFLVYVLNSNSGVNVKTNNSPCGRCAIFHLTTSFPPHRGNVASFSLLSCYFHGKCFDKVVPQFVEVGHFLAFEEDNYLCDRVL